MALSHDRVEVLAVPLTVVFVALLQLYFQTAYPSDDGDTIKATYALTALPVSGIAIAWIVDRLRSRSSTLAAIALLSLVAWSAFALPFAIL